MKRFGTVLIVFCLFFTFSDDLVQMIVDYLKENPSMWVIALVTAGIGFVAAILMRRSAPAPKKSKKSDKKEKSSGKEKSSDSTESKKKQK